MKRALVLFAFASLNAFAIDGVVRNATTNKPQAGAAVSLLQMTGAGPQKLATVTSGADGSFSLTSSEAAAPGPRLVQALYQGVTYTKIVPPGTPETGVQVDVYDASTKPGPARVSTHMMLLEPADGALNISESFVYSNPRNITYNDSVHGTLHFYLPAAAQGKVSMSVLSPNSMAVRRQPIETNQPNVYKVDFPIKPGDSRIDLTYQMPFTSPGKFETKVLFPGADTKLLAPPGVTLAANNLQSIGQEPRSKASIYDFKGADLLVDVQGSGALARQTDQSAQQSGSDQQGGGESGADIAELLPQLYSKTNPAGGLAASVNSVKWILTMIFSLLALGFAYLYRRGGPAPSKNAPFGSATRVKHDRVR